MEIINNIRSIVAMKLLSLALSVAPYEEKAKFVGIVYATYGTISFDSNEKAFFYLQHLPLVRGFLCLLKQCCLLIAKIHYYRSQFPVLLLEKNFLIY